jgi:nitroreductase
MQVTLLNKLKHLNAGEAFKMKSLIKNIFPQFFYTFIREKVRYFRLSKSYFYDFTHYFNNSMNIDDFAENKLASRIIMDTHVIEKGLTMPDTRFGFGQPRLHILITNIICFINNFNSTNPQILHGISVIHEYIEFHKKNNVDLLEKSQNLYKELCDLQNSKSVSSESKNQIKTTKEQYFKHIDSSFKEFSDSRSSLRDFTDESISLDKIHEVLDLCRNTPSACNRQSVRVHLYTNKNKIADILKVQGGNRGFGHLTEFLLVVTYDSAIYFEQNERNSGLVDGGMYCMNILYSLHANGIAGCILNTANAPAKDINMRKVTDIPEGEYFVAMIACGVPPDEFKIATSFRYPLNFILTEHN